MTENKDQQRERVPEINPEQLFVLMEILVSEDEFLNDAVDDLYSKVEELTKRLVSAERRLREYEAKE